MRIQRERALGGMLEAVAIAIEVARDRADMPRVVVHGIEVERAPDGAMRACAVRQAAD